MKLPRIAEPWALDPVDIFAGLATAEQGLSSEEAARRLGVYGANTFRSRERKGPLKIFLRQLASPLIFILIGAGVITFLLGEWVETFVVALAVAVNVGLGFVREYHAENTLKRLTTYIKDRTRVIRDGREEEIDAEDLVPGDVIKLSYGMRVPADARVCSVNGARLDEAILTGESAPIEKSVGTLSVAALMNERTNMLHAGTLVVDGFATAVVAETGDRTEIGKIAGLVVGIDRAQTPIQRALGTLSWIIFLLVIIIVAGIFALGIHEGQPLFEMLVLAAAVSVGAVPEALPIALTVILSIGAERIAKKQGVTRTLAAAETLGSATLILTDKTGTLTMAEMELVGAYTASELSAETPPTGRGAGTGHRALLELALRNVDVFLENPDAAVPEWTWKGKPFEVNIMKNARAVGIDVRGISAAPLVVPFNSTHKFSVSDAGGEYVVMGAPEILLARSAVSKDEYLRIEAWLAAASEDGNRLIALATHPKSRKVAAAGDIEHLEFLGVLAFRDPIRAEVPDAIRKIEAQGVRVAMITGDLKGTALFVARAIGWDIAPDQALTGAELRLLSDDELLAMLPRMRVFARVTPEDKLRVGTLYRALGEVVAMTGDGVNDAPALKAMDIGVALGSGSDVAKSAADLVLLNDDFLTISSAIQEGRRILANIRKTLVYLMANSLDEVFVVGGSLLLALPLPLTALQIIWVNLFTGSLTALSFAYDENFDHDAPNRHGSTAIFTPAVKGQIFGIGIISSLLLFFIYYGLIRFGVDLGVARSVFFVCFASYISVVAFSFRSLHKPLFSYPVFSNRRLNVSVIISFAVLILTMAVPAMRRLFELAPMPAVWLWFVAAWLIVNVLIVEAAKKFFGKA
jgi:Ca2+-transporting ATPase